MIPIKIEPELSKLSREHSKMEYTKSLLNEIIRMIMIITKKKGIYTIVL